MNFAVLRHLDRGRDGRLERDDAAVLLPAHELGNSVPERRRIESVNLQALVGIAVIGIVAYDLLVTVQQGGLECVVKGGSICSGHGLR